MALILHKFPHEIEEMPIRDMYAVLDVHAANEEIKAWHEDMKLSRMKSRRRGR